MRRIAICLALAASAWTLATGPAAAAAAAGAAADPPTLTWMIPFEPTRITIKRSDLDVRTPAGATQLLRRIEDASRRACGSAPSDVRRIDHRRLFQYCVKLNIAAAVTVADEPMVTSLFNGRPRGVMLAWH